MPTVRSCPEVLFKDTRLVILNKPAGLPSHAGPLGGASVEDWFPLLSRRANGPWLAHRLDADTAGCLVIALRKATLIALQDAFAAGRVRKTYWAICRGRPSPDTSIGLTGTLDGPLARRTSKAGWHMRIDPTGRTAVTHWRVLGVGHDACWLELTPHTGRTHQIRVHCAALGCPILGDPVYGEGRGRLHLLARAIRLPLDPEVSAVAPLPPHMNECLLAAGWPENVTPAETTP